MRWSDSESARLALTVAMALKETPKWDIVATQMGVEGLTGEACRYVHEYLLNVIPSSYRPISFGDRCDLPQCGCVNILVRTMIRQRFGNMKREYNKPKSTTDQAKGSKNKDIGNADNEDEADEPKKKKARAAPGLKSRAKARKKEEPVSGTDDSVKEEHEAEDTVGVKAEEDVGTKTKKRSR